MLTICNHSIKANILSSTQQHKSPKYAEFLCVTFNGRQCSIKSICAIFTFLTHDNSCIFKFTRPDVEKDKWHFNGHPNDRHNLTFSSVNFECEFFARIIDNFENTHHDNEESNYIISMKIFETIFSLSNPNLQNGIRNEKFDLIKILSIDFRVLISILHTHIHVHLTSVWSRAMVSKMAHVPIVQITWKDWREHFDRKD